MLFKSTAVLALITSVAAQNAGIQFTKANPAQLGLLRRQAEDLEPGYEPEEAQCSDGATCDEACGKGFIDCVSNNSQNYCYNPEAGQICCDFIGEGKSCEKDHFCAHTADKHSFCCKNGSSRDDCAKVNNLEPGSLTSDPPVPKSTGSSPTSTKEPKAGGTGRPEPTANGTDSTPTKGSPSPSVKQPSAATMVAPATAFVILAAGVFAAVF